MTHFVILLISMYWIISWFHRCLVAYLQVPFTRKLLTNQQRRKTNLKKGLALSLFYVIISSPGFWLFYQAIFSGGCL